jgi:DNA-binding response OmpR family regulator
VKKVVVVEDDPELRELETFLLDAEGYQAIGVPDGETAAAVVKAEAADLVLLDLMLPRKDGNAVLVDLAADPATAGAPVVVISAYLHQLRATSQVKRVLAKPFDINELLEAVETVLAAERDHG